MPADNFARQRVLPTLAWTGAGAIALIVAQILGVVVFVIGSRLTHSGQAVSTYGILHNGRAIPASVVLSTATTILFLWGLTRIRTRDVAEYLALCWPRGRRELIVSVILFILFMGVQIMLARYAESSGDLKFVQDLIASARATDDIPLVAAALMLAAPIGEELAFRGFLYRTLELRFGGTAAIVATAMGWAALHIQYSLIGIVVVFAGGLLFGTIRRYSGSLYLTMLLHAIWNGMAFAGVLLVTSKG